MTLLIWQAISWVSWGWGGFLLPILKKVPWQVWVGIAGIIAVLWYGHVREQHGYEKCQAQVKEATDREVARQAQVSKEAIEASKTREAEASAKAQKASEERDAIESEFAKLKESKATCIPKSITDKYRSRSLPNH